MSTEYTSPNNVDELVSKYRAHKTNKNFTKLINAIEKPLYFYLHRYLKDSAEVKGVMSNVYEVVWTKIDSYNPDYKFSTWIYFIAKNMAINIKKRKCVTVPLIDTDAEEFADGDFSELIPSDAELRELFLNMVVDAVKMLPEPYSSTMYLKDVKGVKIVDVAELLNVNSCTIRSRLTKARKDVKEYLEIKHPDIIEILRLKTT